MQKEETNPVSADEIQRLIAAIKEATGAGEGVVKSAVLRLRLCIDVGGMLSELKAKMKHGQWQRWCEDIKGQVETFNVSIRTLRRWMSLHKQNDEGKIDVSSAKGLRHAYQLAGIVPESEDAKSTKPAAQEAPYVIHLLRFAACIPRIDIEAMEVAERTTLRERLEPIHKLYLEIA